MQLGLKKAAKDGEKNPDGPQPAVARRGRRPKAKASPNKLKAKSKAAPKKAAAKSKIAPSSSAAAAPKSRGKRTSKQADLDADRADGDGLAAPEKVEEKPKAYPKKPKKEKVQVEKEADVLPATDGTHKCFARRRRPASAFPMAKWDAIRQAFQQKVKPLLVAYSAHEDRMISYVFPLACSSPSLFFVGDGMVLFHILPSMIPITIFPDMLFLFQWLAFHSFSLFSPYRLHLEMLVQNLLLIHDMWFFFLDGFCLL